jgi:hypothetical protein
MARSSTLVLADLITANRLPGFRIGALTTNVVSGPASPSAVAAASAVASDSEQTAPRSPESDSPFPIPLSPPGPVDPGADTQPGDWSLEALTGRLVELSNAGTSVALTAVTSLLLEAQLRREPAAWVAIGDATFYPPDMAEAGCDLENLPVVRVGDARTAARAADLLLRSGGFRLVVLDGVGSPYVRTRAVGTGRSRFYPGYGPAYSQNADRQAMDALGAPSGQGRGPYGNVSGSSNVRFSDGGSFDPRSSGDRSRGSGRRYVSTDSRSRGFPGDAPADGAGARQSAASSRGRFDDPYHRETSASIPPAAQTRLAGLTKRHQAVLVCITYKERGASSLGALVSLRGTGRVRKTAFDRFTWELEALKDKRRAPGWEHSGVCRGPTGLF